MNRILVVRLGAMGDVIHALPAVATLKHSFPQSRLVWAIEPKWAPLLEGNPFVDDVLPADRRDVWSLGGLWRRLRAERFDFAVDFQGLIKSALIAAAAQPQRIYGFCRGEVREKFAALLYSNVVKSHSVHVVDKNLELAQGTGATNPVHTFHVPAGQPEGDLPGSGFVLANPTAGWRSKQWPLENYSELGRLLRRQWGLELVLNGAARIELAHTWAHVSGLNGLIDATRRAVAIVGVDSGPMHLAAALGKPGVALFGPTDPARNGPCGGSLQVLRSPNAATTYKREPEISASMREIGVDQVFEALRSVLACAIRA